MGPLRRYSSSESSEQSGLIVLLFCALYIGGFYLFDSVIILTVGRGLETQQIAIAFHATFLVICLLSVWIFRMKNVRIYRGRLVVVAGVFWGLYFLRIILDGYLFPCVLRMPPEDYVKWAAGVCFVPMIAFSHPMSDKTARWVYHSLVISALVCGLVSLVEYKQFLGTDFGRIGEELSTVNPLTVGYLGSSLVALALYSAIVETGPLMKRLPLVFACGSLGFVALVLAASRGPIVAAIVCYIVIAASTIWRRKGVRTIVYSLIVVAGSLYLPSVAEKMGSGIGLRFESMESEFDVEGGSRMTLMTDAWGQFLGHPILGSGLEEANSSFYPHNVVVESFMATGLFGGIAFTLLLSATCFQAWRLLIYNPNRGWLSVLFFHALVASLFSGALCLSNQLWYLIGAVAATSSLHSRFNLKNQRKDLDDKSENSYNQPLEHTHARAGTIGFS